MVSQSTRYHESGGISEAEAGDLQVRGIVPDQAVALRQYARLLVRPNRDAEAEPVFQRWATDTGAGGTPPRG